MTISEIAEIFSCSTTAIWKALKKLKITRKKKTNTYKEQDPVKVKEYLDIIDKIPSDKIVYVDETGIEQYLYRTENL